MAGKGGGAWKVAYADFVTAMMAFFMVMWLVSQNKPVKEAVAQYFSDPYGTKDRPAGSPLPQFRKNLHPGGSRIKQQTKTNSSAEPTDKPPPDTIVIRGDSLKVIPPLMPFAGQRSSVGTMIPFEEFSTELTPDQQRQLQAFTPLLLGKTNRIEIRGHTGRRALPADSAHGSSWELAYARCDTVMRLLLEAGIDPRRIRLSQSASYEPLPFQSNAEWLNHSSRVEIYLLNELIEDVSQAHAPAGEQGNTHESPAHGEGHGHEAEHAHEKGHGHASDDGHGHAEGHTNAASSGEHSQTDH
ncbi:MAG: flagellar motor protein MotB [Pirellulales bacterium]|nr:flagellar motor protein MotB [Pirellulales bacterium]